MPVDIQWETMGPTLHDVKSKITKNTVAIVFSYPYGIVYDITEVALFCKSRNIDVIEDMSEAFSGLYATGSPAADLTLLSFGMLKHESSFGGSIAIVRHNQEIYDSMLEIEKSYKSEPPLNYFTRVMKALRLIFLLNQKSSYFHSAKELQLYKILHYWRKPIYKLRQRISLP